MLRIGVPGSVPGASDSACIANTFTNTITIGALANGNQTISSLTSGAPLSFTIGPLTVSGGSTFSANLGISGGTLTLNGAASTTNLNLAGGTLTGSGAITVTGVLNWTGGNATVAGSGGLTIASGATGNINPDNGANLYLYTTLTNNGTVVESAATGSNNFHVRNPGMIVNNTSWTINDSVNNLNVTADSGVVSFTNNGTFVKNGTGTTAWQVPIQTSGSVQINAGVFNAGNFTQTAGSTSLAAGTTLGCTCTFQGGSLTGIGTIRGSVTNTGANVEPGTPGTFGRISISGTYSQSGTGSYTWQVGKADCTQFDDMTVSGAATLGGAINLANNNGCSPANGTSFTAMSFASRTGQFATSSSGWDVTYTATTVVATFQGGGGNPHVMLSPTKLNLATQVVGTNSKAKKVKVANTGSATLTISSISLTGSDPGDFSQTNDFPNVQAGQSCSITVKFKPTDKGNRSATVTITDNADTGTQTVPLTGVGTFLSVIPNPIAFASQLLNTTGSPLTVTLQNVNPAAAITITSITLAGADASDFTENSSCAVIPANGTCSFSMTLLRRRSASAPRR